MTQAEFQFIVQQNADWFEGVHPETAESLAEAEQQLGCHLPTSLKWLLITKGYSEVCGVDSLEESVAATLRVRQSLRLPARYVLLNDWQGAGIVFFDTATASPEREYRVYWAGTHNLYRLVEGEEMDKDIDVFDDYPAWVQFQLEKAKEEAKEAT